MMTYHQMKAQAEARRHDLICEAQAERQRHEATASQPTTPIYGPALASFGAALVRLGEGLQARYDAVNRELNPVPPEAASPTSTTEMPSVLA